MKRVNLSLPVLAAICLASIGSAVASEQDGQWYLTGMGTYVWPDSNRGLENDLGGGQIGIGRAVTPRWNAELALNYLALKNNNQYPGNGGDADLASVMINGMFVWNRTSSFSPYLLAGIGALDADVQFNEFRRDGTDLAIQVGPGFLWDIGTKRLAIRAELIGRWADSVPSSTDVLANVGLQWSFGKERVAPVAAAAAVVAVVPSDSDGDGVTDDLDLCPGTPAGVVVDAEGCPIDSDGDGVADGIDECPTTIEGTLVNDVGCGYQLTGAHYEFDSDKLNYDAETILDELAVRLAEYPDVILDVEGHTDSSGEEAYNIDLSQRRAQSAIDYLVGEGIDESRFEAVGLGSSDPVASNDTEEGRAANRRVVFKRDL